MIKPESSRPPYCEFSLVGFLLLIISDCCRAVPQINATVKEGLKECDKTLSSFSLVCFAGGLRRHRVLDSGVVFACGSTAETPLFFW